MHVLHLSSGHIYGGVEAHLFTLSRERNGCPGLEQSFALCHPGRLADELTGAGTVPAILGPVQTRFPWLVWRARWRLRRLLQRQRFDAVICHSAWPHGLYSRVVRQAGLPLVYWSHDIPKGTHWVERWAARTPPDLVIANSRLTQAALPKLFPFSPSAVIYPPVSTLAGAGDQGHRAAVRQKLGTPRDATVIIQFSRLDSCKGHALLLESLGKIKDCPGWWCWVAGGPQCPHEHAYLRGLRDLAKRQGISERVQFLGQRTDIPQLLAAADIHCQPNAGPEAFGIAFVEALTASLPVVTTALGGAREIVDESCGLLTPPGDAAALAAALRRLVSEPAWRHALAAGGPRRAARLCDPADQLRRLQIALSGVCSQRLAA